MSTLQVKVALQSGVEVPAALAPSSWRPSTPARSPAGQAPVSLTCRALSRRPCASSGRPAVRILRAARRRAGDAGRVPLPRPDRCNPGSQVGSAGDSGQQLTLELDKGAVAAITAPDPQPDPSVPRLDRHAYFVPVSEARVPFEAAPTVQVAPIRVANGGWTSLASTFSCN